MNLCPTAWSTGPDGKGGGVVCWPNHGHVCACLSLPERAKGRLQHLPAPDTSGLLAQNQNGTVRGSEGLGRRNKDYRLKFVKGAEVSWGLTTTDDNSLSCRLWSSSHPHGPGLGFLYPFILNFPNNPEIGMLFDVINLKKQI